MTGRSLSDAVAERSGRPSRASRRAERRAVRRARRHDASSELPDGVYVAADLDAGPVDDGDSMNGGVAGGMTGDRFESGAGDTGHDRYHHSRSPGWWWMPVYAALFVAVSVFTYGNTAERAAVGLLAAAVMVAVVSVHRLARGWSSISDGVRWGPVVLLLGLAAAFVWGSATQTELVDKPLLAGTPVELQVRALYTLREDVDLLDVVMPEPDITGAEIRSRSTELLNLAGTLDGRVAERVNTAWPGPVAEAALALAEAEDAASVWLRAVEAAAQQPTPGRDEDRAAAEVRYRAARVRALEMITQAEADAGISGRSWQSDRTSGES
jgi:hypothetical protein